MDGGGGLAIVDLSIPGPVQLEHCACLVPEQVAHDLDATILEVLVRRGKDRALLEVELRRILASRAVDHALHAAPERGAQTHRARLAGCEQVMSRQPGCAQREAA